MVTIKYFPDPTCDNCVIGEYDRVADFLSEGFTRDELVDFRFYQGDVLGEEIDTSDGSFIDIDTGEVVVLKRSMVPNGATILIAVAVGILTAVATVLLTPKPKVPDLGNRKQQSATNSLDKPSNQPRINQRIDDIFGFVAKHTPPLWQVPYRIGINDQETEVLLLCVGRGKYDINPSRILDGDTPFNRIQGARANVYEPGTHPGNGSPTITVGGIINQPMGIYREPGDLNPTELLPPNDLDVAAINWRITSVNNGNGTWTVTLRGTDVITKGLDLTSLFLPGDNFDVRDFTKFVNTGTQSLWNQFGTLRNFTIGYQVWLDGPYVVGSLTEDTLSFVTSNSDWGGLSNYAPVDSVFFADNGFLPDSNNYVGIFTLDSEINRSNLVWSSVSGQNPPELTKMRSRRFKYNPSVGDVTTNLVGPVFIDKSVEKVIVNLTSMSGYYKLVENNEVSISATIEFIIEELDGNNNVINSFSIFESYNSNPSNVTFSVYRTYEIDTSNYNNNIRILARRNTFRDKSQGVSNVDKIEWTSLYTFESLPDGHDFGDVTLLHTMISSNSQSRLVKDRVINLDVTRKVTRYLGNGQFGPTESYPTDDFSQVLIHTALDPHNGGLSLHNINADGFLLLKDQITNYFGSDIMTKFGYDFDDTQTTYDEIFTIISNVVNCIPYVQNGRYDAFFERTQPTSTMQITHRNKLPDTETREDIFDVKYDGVELTYRDRVTGISEVIYVPDDRSSINPERIEYPGCTTKLQAYRRALRIYNKQRYHMFNAEFSVDEFGRMIVPGQRIDSPDGTRFVRHTGNTDGYRVYDGDVVEVRGLVVELSEPVTFIDGENHYIQFTNSEGDNSELILCTKGVDDFTVVLSSLPVDSIYDGFERDKTKFTFCSEQLRESIALIPQTIEFSYNDGQETNVITSINYHAGYYTGDTETI